MQRIAPLEVRRLFRALETITEKPILDDSPYLVGGTIVGGGIAIMLMAAGSIILAGQLSLLAISVGLAIGCFVGKVFGEKLPYLISEQPSEFARHVFNHLPGTKSKAIQQLLVAGSERERVDWVAAERTALLSILQSWTLNATKQQ